MNLLKLSLISFGGGGSPRVAPALPEPTTEDPEVEEAKRKERELARRRRGRRGTILTGPKGLDEQKTTLG